MTAITLSDLDESQLTQEPISSHLAVLDYIPLVSTVSGAARAFFGSIQSAVGVVLLPVQIAGRMAGHKQSFILIQGIANVVRGIIAAKPIVGNIAMYLYDSSKIVKKDFQIASGIMD